MANKWVRLFYSPGLYLNYASEKASNLRANESVSEWADS